MRTCIIRSADFFGPGVYQSAVGFEVLSNVLSGKPAYLVGDPYMPHSLTYLPDLVRTMATLANEDDAYGEVWHTANLPALSLKTFLEEVAQQTGLPPKIRTVGRLLLRTLGLFKPDMRELVEMLYLYEQPFTVDHRKINERFALEPTRLVTALEDTITWVRRENTLSQGKK